MQIAHGITFVQSDVFCLIFKAEELVVSRGSLCQLQIPVGREILIWIFRLKNAFNGAFLTVFVRLTNEFCHRACADRENRVHFLHHQNIVNALSSTF